MPAWSSRNKLRFISIGFTLGFTPLPGKVAALAILVGPGNVIPLWRNPTAPAFPPQDKPVTLLLLQSIILQRAFMRTGLPAPPGAPSGMKISGA